MPFESYRQFKFMMARHPDIAKKWMKEGYSIPRKPANYKPNPIRKAIKKRISKK